MQKEYKKTDDMKTNVLKFYAQLFFVVLFATIGFVAFLGQPDDNLTLMKWWMHIVIQYSIGVICCYIAYILADLWNIPRKFSHTQNFFNR